MICWPISATDKLLATMNDCEKMVPGLLALFLVLARRKQCLSRVAEVIDVNQRDAANAI